jgi:hypothetical protein
MRLSGKPAQHGASNLALDDLVLNRAAQNRRHGGIDSSHEICTKALAAGFVPIDGCCKLRFGLRS